MSQASEQIARQFANAYNVKNIWGGIIVNVKEYGAKGDGVTDDTAAINSATAGGGTIYVPEGIYMINADNPTNSGVGGIYLPDDTTLILHPKAIIKAITSSSIRYNIIRIAKASRVKVIGGTIQGERDTHIGTTGEWGYGILVNESSYVEILGVKIQDCWGDGIVVGSFSTKPSQYVTIKNVISDNNRRQGLSLILCKDVIVEDSVFSNTNGTAPEAGIDLEPDLANQISNITVRNCRAYGNNGEGIQVYEDVTNFQLVNNHCYDNRLSGIKVMLGASNGKVTGNNCSNNAKDGIWIFGATGVGNPKNIDVKNNIVLNNGRVGIRIERSYSVTAIGNIVKSNTEQGFFVTQVEHAIIDDNHAESNTLNGIYVLNTSKYIKIAKNRLKNNGGSACIFFLTNVTNSIVEQNVIEGSNTFGVLFNDTTVSNCQVNNNDFTLFTGTTQVGNNGVGCVVSDKRTTGGLVTTAPTAGTWIVGQVLYNSAPTLIKNISHWTCISTTPQWVASGCGQGTTANRPVLTTNDVGYSYFDTTLAKMIAWSGTAWLV